MSEDASRAITADIERVTGYDSIATIERVYWDGKRYECCFPHCKWTHHDSLMMWRHIHGLMSRGNKHPCSWLPAPVNAAARQGS